MKNETEEDFVIDFVPITEESKEILNYFLKNNVCENSSKVDSLKYILSVIYDVSELQKVEDNEFKGVTEDDLNKQISMNELFKRLKISY